MKIEEKTIPEEIKQFFVGTISKSGHLVRISLDKKVIKEMLNGAGDYIVCYAGCNEVSLVLGELKKYTQILKRDYFDWCAEDQLKWPQKTKDEFKRLQEERVRLNWGLAMKRITQEEYDIKIAQVDEKISELRGSGIVKRK